MRKIWFFISFFIIVLDQVSKYLARHFIHFSESIAVVPGFDLTLRYNTGAAFSFLADGSGWQRWFLVGLALAVSVMLIIWLIRLPSKEKLEGLSFSLILGGALGNLIDRIFYGHVVDFILLYYKHWEWPAFNVADSAITVGVALFVWRLFKR